MSQSMLLPAFFALFGVVAAVFLLGFGDRRPHWSRTTTWHERTATPATRSSTAATRRSSTTTTTSSTRCLGRHPKPVPQRTRGRRAAYRASTSVAQPRSTCPVHCARRRPSRDRRVVAQPPRRAARRCSSGHPNRRLNRSGSRTTGFMSTRSSSLSTSRPLANRDPDVERTPSASGDHPRHAVTIAARGSAVAARSPMHANAVVLVRVKRQAFPRRPRRRVALRQALDARPRLTEKHCGIEVSGRVEGGLDRAHRGDIGLGRATSTRSRACGCRRRARS